MVTEMGIELQLNCLRYFGFGGGWMMGAGQRSGDDGALYCNGCPLRAECWKLHKERAAGLLPELVAEFERRAETKRGPDLVKEWFEEFQTADPYTWLMTSNIQAGIWVAQTNQAPDRGRFTVPWPFKEVANGQA